MGGGACPNCGTSYDDCVAIVAKKRSEKGGNLGSGRCCDQCSHSMSG